MALEPATRGTDLEAVGERFGDVLRATRVDADEPTLVVEADALRDVLAFLRDERGFQLLRSVTAVDFHPAEPRFQLVYHLTAVPPAAVAGEAEPSAEAPTRLLRLKIALPGSEPVADSVVALYPTADYHEREVYDMFGIEFRGHPDLRRILMPETFDGHPLRKDYPLVYEEVAFSGNAERVHASKPRAER